MEHGGDSGLVERARGGDSEAFRQLVERHGAALFKLAFRLVGDEALAEDVVQETLLRAWRSLGSFDGRSELGTWLHRIASNCAVDALRKRAQRGRELELDAATTARDAGERGRGAVTALEHGLETTGPALAAGDPGPDRHAQSGQIAAAVARVLPTLSPLERAAFVLRHVEGCSTAEIAGALGVELQASKHAVFRAVQKLRLALQPFVAASSATRAAAPAGRGGALGGIPRRLAGGSHG